MKKAIFTLAVLVMAFGNVGMAQMSLSLKSAQSNMVFKHYGMTRETVYQPSDVMYSRSNQVMYRGTFSYDEEFNRYEELYERTSATESWTNYYLKSYEYDFYGNVMEELLQTWVDDEWVNDSRIVYTYSGTQISEAVSQLWDGEWKNDVKVVYNYDGDEMTQLYWTWNGSVWSSSELYTYTFTNESIDLLMQYMQGGAWQNEQHKMFMLDFNQNVKEILVENWENNAWVNAENWVYSYEGDVYTLVMVQQWKDNDWQDYRKVVYTYENGNAKHGEYWQWSGSEWFVIDEELEMPYNYNTESMSFFCYVVDMNYVDLTGVEENTQSATFKVYPVPAEGEITIEAVNFQKAELYSLTGQKVMESEKGTFKVDNLQAGVYMLKVYDLNGNSESQRIVVK